MIPNFITHYHLADKAPFLNLSDLSERERASVLSELQERYRSEDGFKRQYGKRYMQLRQLTEARLRDLFISRSGKPQRHSPHYFVLGKSFWFKNLHPNTREVRISLDYLRDKSVSFTYPDSFVSMGFMPEFSIKVAPQPYHEKVYLLNELPEVVAKFGLPQDDFSMQYQNYSNEEFEKFIEVQVWDDSPLAWCNDC
ncbi:hypothetical protein C1752_00179 [Acaryochloris thomasi RCC1774]|uniref:Uncharacterized protein n=1 Tax=Acaryochloris thomasi RCC1774 TaxID=1764569 RepID=A0A2W1JPZ8_9CYAN|nr:hypothetical protein C1752_00179 [Acaryochloris thomasi RCC1774]